MPTAALYLRSSKDRADISPETQRQELLQLAGNRQLTVVREFVDVVQSGKTEDRPGFQELLQALRDPRRTWTQLLILDTSRLARNMYLAQAFEHECRRRGVTIIYSKLPEMDPITEVIVKGTFQAFDQVHSMMSREKGRAGMATNVRRGFRAGGRAPRGYVLEHVDQGVMRDGRPVLKSRLQLGPDAEEIRRYLELRADGHARAEAAAAAGIENKPGLIELEWNALTYAGSTVWNVRHMQEEHEGFAGGIKRRPRAEWIIQPGTHPALITAEQAEVLLQRLEVSNHGERRHRTETLLLGGLLRTPAGQAWHCDGRGAYRGPRDGGRTKSIKAELIDQAVLQQISADMDSPEFVRQVALETRRQRPQRDPVKPLRSQLQQLERKIANMMDAAAEMATGRGAALRRVQELEEERIGLQEKLLSAEEAWAKTKAVRAITEDQVRACLANLVVLPADDRPALRRHLPQLLERVELDPETLECRLQYRILASAFGPSSPERLKDRLMRDRMASPWGFEPIPHPLTASRSVPIRPHRRRGVGQAYRPRARKARGA